jgi:peptide/nickel transport system substrate-binding protein
MRTRMGRFLVVSAAAATLAFALPAAAKTPKDQLIVGMNMANLTSLDPHNMNSYESHHILANVYDTLVRTDPKDPGKLMPRLAESWQELPDGTIKFKLRKDVKFHSGRVVTIDDVVWSMRRAVKLGLLGSAYFTEWGYNAKNIDEKFRAEGTDTFVMEPAMAIAPKLKLYTIARAVGAVLDRETVLKNEKDGDLGRGWLASNSAGSGPFSLVRWNPNDIVLLDRFDGYYAGAPKMRRVVVRHLPESQTQRLQLEKGDLDVGIQLSSADIDGLAANPAIAIDRISGAGFYFMIMSLKDPDFAKPEVRKAVRYCIDYDGINKNLMQNYGLPARTYIAKGIPGHVEGIGNEYDLEKCKAGLAAAGYPNGFKKTFLTLSSPPYAEISTAIQANLAKAGIILDIRAGNGDQTYGPMRNRQFESGLGRSSSAVQADPDGWLRTHVYNPDNTDAAKLSNLLGWRSSWAVPEVNRLMDEAASISDEARRAQLYAEVVKLSEAAVPSVIPVSQRVDPYAKLKRLQNYVGDATWMVRWDIVDKTD